MKKEMSFTVETILTFIGVILASGIGSFMFFTSFYYLINYIL